MNAADAPIVELDLLRTLVAISDTGSFSAAANLVHRSPSAVSMQVKRLEEVIGKPLFLRDSRSVSLTADGEHLLAHGRRVLELNCQVVSRFRATSIAGAVRLGALDHAVEQFLPLLLRRFHAAYPEITVDVTVENSDILLSKMRRKELDIALVTCAPDTAPDQGIEVLRREALVWVGAKGGIAVEQTPLPVSVWEEGCVWRTAALSALEKQGRDYRVSFKSAYIAGQKAAVLADLVVAPLPATACGNDMIILTSATGLPPLGDFSLGMVIPDNPSPPIKAVAEQLRQDICDGSV